MAPSQLKRLKASLREQGIVGPQQSKKQRIKNAQDRNDNKERVLRKSAVIEGIREQFNPFDVKRNPRGPKFDVATSRPADNNAVKGRPGAARAMGEEKRRQTLLVEMQRRNKVGGIIDRRFGENDPNISAEDKMLERFSREKQRLFKKHSVFDLDEGLPEEDTTPFGKSVVDDFDEEDMEDSDHYSSDDSGTQLKRSHADMAFGDGDKMENGEPMYKKTKAEVMKEVIAKSKFHKYERQAAKEENEDMREELDGAFGDVGRLVKTANKLSQNDRTDKLIRHEGMDVINKDFIPGIKTLAQKAGKATLSSRTRTEEEISAEKAEKLQEAEDKKLRRMRGEEVSEDESEESEGEAEILPNPNAPFWMQAEEKQEDFGLGTGNRIRPTATELGFDDEDDFVIDRDLVGSDSEMEPVTDDEDGPGEEEDDEEDDSDAQSEDNMTDSSENDVDMEDGIKNPGLPSSLPCPQTHDELLMVTKRVPLDSLHVAIYRIRSQYHPRLAKNNKELLAKFSRVLVEHISYLGNNAPSTSFGAIEVVTRHTHSLAKSYPIDVATEFRARIEEISRDRPLCPTIGDLCILTAISSIFPTSDHFHQVATPAMLVIARYLGQKIPHVLSDYATGTFLATLAYQYQCFSKRYVPEALQFCLNCLCSLAPLPFPPQLATFPLHEPPTGIRIEQAQKSATRNLKITDCLVPKTFSPVDAAVLKVSLINTNLQLISNFSTLWTVTPSYIETFSPARAVLSHLITKPNLRHLPRTFKASITSTLIPLSTSLSVAHIRRRPLELHHHKPLAIKSHVPKFEATYDPEKHYDPDRDRAESRKLAKEHRTERKGAMRELRRDAHFMAREKLRAKVARDGAYEKKFKRLAAEVQGEEGREAKEYEREKDRRKRARN